MLILAIVLLYGNVGTITGKPGMASGILLAGVFGLTIPIFYKRVLSPFTLSPIVVWTYGYLVVSMLWSFLAPDTLESTLAIWTTVVYVTVFFLVYTLIASQKMLVLALHAISAATMIAVVLNVYEFFHPGLYSSVVGRSAGFYINANVSALAIVMGTILSIRVVPATYRLIFLSLTGLGVLLTFSRSGIICFIAAVVLMQLSPALKINARTMLLSGLLGIAVLLSPVGSAFTKETQAIFATNPQILSKLSGISIDSLKRDSRFYLIHQALDQITISPLLGRGTGIPLLDAGGGIHQAPHNLYLSLWIQFGVLGLLILPTMLLCLLKTPRPKPAPEVKVLIAILAIQGFFSHGMLIQWQYAIVIAIAARMSSDYEGIPSWKFLHVRFSKRRLSRQLSIS